MFLSFALLAAAVAEDPFVFKDGDRVVWLGGTLIEREQETGFWEAALTVKNRPAKVTFRNLGWSGDTVWGESRNGFDESPKGFERLVSLTTELKPTVIIVCYGQNESFAGEAGLSKFRDGLNKLLDALAPTKARVVLMTPTLFEGEGGVAKSELLELYLKTVRAVAAERGHGLHELYGPSLFENPRLTENGVHLTPDGYARTARLLAAGMTVPDELRLKIVAKNRLFFHRWRPQNETYLFGFRKHEQGRNAAEVAAFDPLVAAAEAEIHRLIASPARP